MIEVLEGPFAHFQGKVEEIDQDKGKVRVSVDMFGRETNMELDFEQVRKNLMDYHLQDKLNSGIISKVRL